MELLNNIWRALTVQNECLINILSIPFTIVEAILLMFLFLSILNIKSTCRQKITYVLLMSIIGLLSKYIIPAPYNLIVNYSLMVLVIYLIFKTTLLQTILAFTLPTVIFVSVGMLISNPYLYIFNISSDTLLYTPIYRLIYVLAQYIIVIAIYCLFKFKNLTLNISLHIDKKHKYIIYCNFAFGLLTLLVQTFVTFYYIDILPKYMTFLSFIIILVYFILSIYSLTRVVKLDLTTQKLENAEQYNKTLTILHDNVRGFKHDFDNIVTTIGGYVKTNDMDGLKKYYLQLEDDCQKVNNLYILNPDLINNPGVYSLLTTKYNEAEQKGIKVNMSLLLDLSKLNMKIYEFTRVLGILLDNAIDASSECEEKIMNIIFRDDSKNHRQLVIVENTYKDKNVDTERIFNKGFSGKENHTGLGLWEVRKILNKSKNLNLYTTKNEKYFSQQIEIYY